MNNKTAFYNAKIISMKDDNIACATLFFENDKIIEIKHCDRNKIPDDFNIIDCTGMYLLPGLADMHA